MKLNYVMGDLIQIAESGFLNAIAHQANCFCKGKSGIASLIFKAFPEAMEADNATEVGQKAKLGSMSFGSVVFKEVDPAGIDPLFVFNLYGQYNWNRRSKDYGTVYDALLSSLREMKATLDKLFGDSEVKVGFPLIGCGLAGGNWGIVEEMIKSTFNDPKYRVFIVTLEELKGKNYVKI